VVALVVGPRLAMRLVVDASTLVAEALRARGRRLLAHPELELYVAAEAWSETEHELRKRVALLVERGHLDAALVDRLLGEVLAILTTRITLVAADVYAARLTEGRRRIPRDADDAPMVALALALDCGIWTADHDFFGCGVPVWTTDTVQAQLEAQPDH
jgi:predicted nucleic acid-binding protein